MSTLEATLTWVKSSAERIGPTLKPDGDWQPTLFIVGEQEGEPDVMIANLSTLPSRAYPAAVTALADRYTGSLKAIAIVLSAWTMKATARTDADRQKLLDEVRAAGGVRNLPNRAEEVIVIACSGNEVQFASAEIIRSSGSPRLDEWDARPRPIMEGALIDSLTGAFKTGGRHVQ